MGPLAWLALASLAVVVLAAAAAVLCARKDRASDEGFVSLVWPGDRGRARATELDRRIWILWLQGFDAGELPWPVPDVLESWVRWNPGWTVERVTRANLGAFVDAATVARVDRIDGDAAKSDVIRLALLAAHGGVWVDATTLCLAPLDMYAAEALDTVAGFWMYHGRNGCTGPSSWYMMAARGSIVAARWKAASDAYWDGRFAAAAAAAHPVEADQYFWMDALFEQLLSSDAEFREAWRVVSRSRKLCCDDPGEAHALAGRVFSTDPDIQATVARVQPYILKLSRHGTPATDDRSSSSNSISNAAFAVRFSMDEGRRQAKKPWTTDASDASEAWGVWDAWDSRDAWDAWEPFLSGARETRA